MRATFPSLRKLSALAVLAACSTLSLPAETATLVGYAPAQRGEGLIFTDSVLASVRDEVKAVESSPDASLAREDTASDASGRYTAFTVAVPFAQDGTSREHIYFTDRRAGKTFEITGLPFEYRPFDNFSFTPRGLLQFDQWVNPRFGTRYRFDVRRRRLVYARGFVDADYVERRKRERRGRP